MPYTHPPICFICGKVHPCDTNDTVQLANAAYVTVNACKSHPGVQEEYDRQENMTTEEKAEFAKKVVSTPEFQKKYAEHIQHLIGQKPQHKEFLESLNF